MLSKKEFTNMWYTTIKVKAYFFLVLFLAIIQLASGQYHNLQRKGYEYLRNKVSDNLGLDKNQFQLAQLNEPVGNTSFWLWHIFDAIPSYTDGPYYNPSQYNNFSSDYGLLLYQSKISKTDKPCNLNDAMLTYYNADQHYIWDKSINDLSSELEKGQMLTINVDTTIVDCTDSCGIVNIVICAHLNHIIVFYAYPYSQIDTSNNNTFLYKPWFVSCYLNAAYNNINQSVLSSINWENAFGLSGYMQKLCKAIIVVDSGNIDMCVSNNEIKFSTRTCFGKFPILLGVLVSSIKDFLH